eukprot:TRINITY_DN15772_c0_g1_i1.p1 TRINITY_DN15772_c0_g1~~TRINITY_DN15772_c0_g1_i1.p1  ORF type:complete len:373 (+),score=34.37 TRINITY_DN15772_c0_g1_i1:96-1214(+)
MKVAIVTTTIYVPKALDKYAENAKQNGHEDVFFVVTGDRKTPVETRPYCIGLSERSGYPVTYLDVNDQLQYLSKYPELNESLPWNCIQRRNISFLYAYEHGADVIITIDDDNFIIGESSDYIGAHLLVQRQETVPTISSESGWFNVCEFLTEERGVPFYHRGFPMGERWKKPHPATSESTSSATVVVNAGMWFGDPDIDAMARLCMDINATSYTRNSSFVLDKSTWSPFNSQNTAVRREVIPAYFMSWCVGRYDDIWPSYVVRRIADHLGHSVAYGFPLVHQERNPHNYFVDFDNERNGMQLTDTFCRVLRETALSGTTYEGCFAELHSALLARMEDPSLKWSEQQRAFITGFCNSMIVWQKTIKRVNACLA